MKRTTIANAVIKAVDIISNKYIEEGYSEVKSEEYALRDLGLEEEDMYDLLKILKRI